MTISEILSPLTGDCANSSGYLTIRIKNNGSVSQTNIPVTATVTSAGSTVVSLSATYPGTINASSTVVYTFQTPFATAAGATYSISASANLAIDQNPSNNQVATTISIAQKAGTPAATGEI